MKPIIFLALLCFFICCNRQVDNKKIDDTKKIKTHNQYNKKAFNDKIKEIYIGKEFFSGDELINYEWVKSQSVKEIDSLSYSIYKSMSANNYIFSLDKFLKNEDVEKFKIIDTVNLKSKNIEVKVDNFSNYKTLNLLLDKKLIRKWKFKTYPKKEQDNINGDIISKKTSIFNSWVNNENYVPEIHITNNGISYLFHGQCIYFFPIKIVNDNEIELLWGETGRDCVYEVFFDDTFDLPKDKIPQKGKPFSKYVVDNGVLKVTYYYEQWLERYKKKITKDDKPFPFIKSFILKEE